MIRKNSSSEVSPDVTVIIYCPLPRSSRSRGEQQEKRKKIPVNQLMKYSWHESRINVILKWQFTAAKRIFFRNLRKLFFPSFAIFLSSKKLDSIWSAGHLKSALRIRDEKKNHRASLQRDWEQIEKQFECLMKQKSAYEYWWWMAPSGCDMAN